MNSETARPTRQQPKQPPSRYQSLTGAAVWRTRRRPASFFCLLTMLSRNRTFLAVVATDLSVRSDMVSSRELCVVLLLFLAVIVFQLYVYVLLDIREFEAEVLDEEQRDVERRRRQDVLLKALNAI
ncbi:unnamed protein product [Caenorhabditis auriculariae]|uniref:Uncharacterized protein n=1 Tax=Caenorhabditis auriculariae TaxID=2777116 RepID=A0A8S1H974_9PELO|nr:unnamed protein product [Caenorhabditis auriculariae]